jgi:peptidoglycan hydrolase-like protein with peptidoglycan-binding domain
VRRGHRSKTRARRSIIATAALASTLLASTLLAACSVSGTATDPTAPTSLAGQVDPVQFPQEAPGPTTTVPQVFAKVVFAAPVAKGARGDDVARIQDRLKQLGFDPGPVDGMFGTATMQSVWAYQRLLGKSRKEADGVVTPELWDRMQDAFPLVPYDAQASGTFLEVDLVRQVAILWNDKTPKLITHISSGDGKDYCSDIGAWCSNATTPAGAYQVTREIKGWRESDLGRLYNPVYFNGGIAVHGSENVPNYRDSHGCVRIPMHIAEYFPSLIGKGDEVLVYDGVRTPREYGAVPAPPNIDDPTRTTTLPPEETTPPVATTVPPTTPAVTASPATAPPATVAVTTKAKPTTAPPTAPPTTIAPITVAPIETAPPVP